MPVKSRRELNLEATRAALLAVARRHFAAHGFAAAEIGTIAAEAAVTTGAIYHHFSSKKGLFRAVAEQIEVELLAAAGAVDAGDPLRRLRAGFEHLIDICAAPDVQRIIFVEAPQVIGPAEWLEIELHYTFGAVRGALSALVAAGIVKPYPIDLMARMLLAMLREVSAEIACAKHDVTQRAQISEMVADVFDALICIENVKVGT